MGITGQDKGKQQQSSCRVCAGLACSLTAHVQGHTRELLYAHGSRARLPLAGLALADKQVEEEEEEDDKAHG
jgi:hypothetical protein